MQHNELDPNKLYFLSEEECAYLISYSQSESFSNSIVETTDFQFQCSETLLASSPPMSNTEPQPLESSFVMTPQITPQELMDVEMSYRLTHTQFELVEDQQLPQQLTHSEPLEPEDQDLQPTTEPAQPFNILEVAHEICLPSADKPRLRFHSSLFNDIPKVTVRLSPDIISNLKASLPATITIDKLTFILIEHDQNLMYIHRYEDNVNLNNFPAPLFDIDKQRIILNADKFLFYKNKEELQKRLTLPATHFDYQDVSSLYTWKNLSLYSSSLASQPALPKQIAVGLRTIRLFTLSELNQRYEYFVAPPDRPSRLQYILNGILGAAFFEVAGNYLVLSVEKYKTYIRQTQEKKESDLFIKPHHPNHQSMLRR